MKKLQYFLIIVFFGITACHNPNPRPHTTDVSSYYSDENKRVCIGLLGRNYNDNMYNDCMRALIMTKGYPVF